MDHKESYNPSQITSMNLNLNLYNPLQRGTDFYIPVHKMLRQWHYPKHTGELEQGLKQEKKKKTNEVWMFFLKVSAQGGLVRFFLIFRFLSLEKQNLHAINAHSQMHTLAVMPEIHPECLIGSTLCPKIRRQHFKYKA